MRILLIGDVVGKPGREIIERAVPGLVREERLDLVVANAENAAGGSGITPAIYRELMEPASTASRLGDHIYRRRKSIRSWKRNRTSSSRPTFRPKPWAERGPWSPRATANAWPSSVCSGRRLHAAGRLPVAGGRSRAGRSCRRMSACVLVDFHAEATSDKQLMGRYLDGRVSAVLGTHTHVPTADECILPGGTAFQCDVGMTGPYESILGRRIDRVMETTLTVRPNPVRSGDRRRPPLRLDRRRRSGNRPRDGDQAPRSHRGGLAATSIACFVGSRT